jgi:serine/threonine-protein kinase
MTAQARLLGGRYQVGELLGYGGMAEVHRGRDLRLGRDVAVKMLRADLARDATFQERFRREAQNSAALNHPAIVAVYDTGEEAGSTGEKLPFIVMEFVNGRTLKEVLAAEQRLQTRRALEIVADVCAALEFSHRHGIIHRDIKPGNVMLTQNGQVKVMDFGIARALASGATTMTQTSAVIGTAQYLSPEQARGESVDARSDVYAAGCVLFELLCGHPPFVGDSPVSVAYQHVREDPRTPSDINPEVPPDVDAIVLKALAKNPLNRYQSAQEMRADALRAVAGRPVLATPVMSEAETMALGGPVRSNTGVTRAIPAGVAGGGSDRRASSWVTAVLAALGVLAVIALGVGIWLNGRTQDPGTPTAIVPKIEGMDEKAATTALTNAKLRYERLSDDVRAEDCTKDRVAEQTPDQGTSVAQNSTVRYAMCAGPNTVTVPGSLVGSTKDSARQTLEGLGLKPEFVLVDSQVSADQVVEVENAGEKVDVGSRVKVKISNNKQAVVPDVFGKSEVEAKAILQAAGFEPIVATKIDNAAPGTVIAQTPGKNAKRNKGTQVNITVSTGPVVVPSGSASPSPSGSPSPGAGGGSGGLLENLLKPGGSTR